MGEIRFVGLDDVNLERSIQSQLETLTDKHLDRIGYHIKNDFEVILHAKAHNDTGERTRHAVNVRVSYPGGTVTAGKDDWDFLVAVRQAFDAVDRQLASRWE
ncbi:hypothetical protein GOV11_02415 [Candidatus Woesearchaeota archaeon]|nr:hypothetical protein [Candidatus Woesearchaeota archaeon]